MNPNPAQPNQTDEQVVRQVYEDSCCWAGWGDNPSVFKIWSERLPSSENAKSILLGKGSTPELAWADARAKLPAAVPEAPPAPVEAILPPLPTERYWFSDAEVLSHLTAGEYQETQIRERLMRMTTGEKYALFRAVIDTAKAKELIQFAKPSPTFAYSPDHAFEDLDGIGECSFRVNLPGNGWFRCALPREKHIDDQAAALNIDCPVCSRKIGEECLREDVLEGGRYCSPHPHAERIFRSKPAAPPADTPTDCPKCLRPHYNMEDSEACRNKPTFAYELSMYLTHNNQQHTFTSQTLQAGIEQFLRDKEK